MGVARLSSFPQAGAGCSMPQLSFASRFGCCSGGESKLRRVYWRYPALPPSRASSSKSKRCPRRLVETEGKWSSEAPSSVARTQLMGQGVGRPERIKSVRLEEYQTMTAEEKEEEAAESIEDAAEKRKQKLKAICGLADLKNEAVGLYNIGFSCCLNSLLQVFFMNRHFTAILRRIKVPFEAAEQKRSVPYQMLLLLEAMQRSKHRSVHPVGLANCLAKHKVRLFVLYDASQLFLILWNLIKSQITDLDLAESLTDMYTINLQENLVCQKCLLETKNSSSMLMLPLPMFNHDSRRVRTLEDSLRCFFAPEFLTEDNMCHCKRCDKKTVCLQGMKVTCLPRILTLHLKRFCSKHGNSTQKISHYLSFPQHLDFSQILTPDQYQPGFPKEDSGLYDLFAVVAHSGSASCGHYCAYIWHLMKRKWYCFNDSSVCQVSWDDVMCTYGHAGLRWSETAYLLVYQKKESA
ncbi:ubl carboxyl-terminal hydrolase 18 [Heteronotia binoei]|uniref:ubl carboxyl-terminal hydrolase 18 n=1 Tax=Heteronotia binoei TaxID=13085 RepID=UPI00292E68DE|nr:ubl carboxyl-terminal hydrolase 18 [Heteronotia binoei]